LARIPFGASSSAIEGVRWMNPVLAATNGLCSRIAARPTVEAILTMRPAA